MKKKIIQDSAITGASRTSTDRTAQSGLEATAGERTVHMVLNAGKTMVGTLPILRAFAGNHLDYVSPFVLFDEFGPVEVTAGSDPLRVDAHPHAGVTPTTYFIAGSGHHKDSLNYDFQIGRGDFMMFSSGRGAIHMEESGQQLFDQGGAYHGFQIWLNTPAAYKFADPYTRVFSEDAMPLVATPEYELKVILGQFHETKSEVELVSPAFYFHLSLKPDGRIEIPTDPGHNAFAYVIDGAIETQGQSQIRQNQVAIYDRGQSLVRLYSKDGADLLVMGGKPLNEPVFSYGPFVMNTEEQIRQCIRNYHLGLMGDPVTVN